MTYAVSDLHGCFEPYRKLFGVIGLGENDTLYVLGDVADRGEGGIDILLDMMTRKNVIPLKGNHDYIACRLLRSLGRTYGGGAGDDRLLEGYRLWFLDGGKPTLDAYLKLDAAAQNKVLAYWNTFEYYAEEEAGGNRFFLSHTLPAPGQGADLFDCPILDFSAGETDYGTRYLPDRITVTGHTPTFLIDPAAKGRIWRGNGHAAIDCGAVFGGPLGVLCLDTGEEFYIT